MSKNETWLVRYTATEDGWERICPFDVKALQSAILVVDYQIRDKMFCIVKNRFDSAKTSFPSMSDIEIIYGHKIRKFWLKQNKTKKCGVRNWNCLHGCRR